MNASKKSFICIIAVCIVTAILQAFGFEGFHTYTKLIIAGIYVLVFGIVFALVIRSKKTGEYAPMLIILAGMLIHSWYVLNTGIYDRQHDIGNITQFDDGITNGGHLGYIEYFVKNRHMPDFAPFDVFAYYHPPLHHILASVIVSINLALGIEYATAFESVQVLTLLYFGILCIVSYEILCKLKGDDDRVSVPALSIVCFHPSLIFMSGYLNNDMITLMMTALTIYFCISFIYEKNTRNLLFIALFMGLGALCKLNACIYALPAGILFLMHIILLFKADDNEQKNKDLITWFKRYLLFLIVCASIGLSFVIRNLVRFHEKPGILSANSDSLQYMGNVSLIKRLFIPTTLDLEYPFHSEYAKASTNVWLITLKTSLFGEMRPDTGNTGLIFSRITIIAGLLTAIVMFVFILYLFIRLINKNAQLGVFLLSAFCTVILSFIAFVIKYPYTCSCDFRYIASVLIFSMAALSLSRHKKYLYMLNIFLLVTSNIFLFVFALNY